MKTYSRESVRPDHLLYWICLGAFLIRVITSYLLPNISHPDETFQYLEQTYRLVTGRGLVPWEYQVALRSYLLAWLIYPVMWITHAITPDPAALRASIGTFLSLLSVICVLAAYRIGRISGGRTHARFAALLVAFWCEIVYFSPHMLADTVAAIPLITALAVSARGRQSTTRQLFISAVLLGFTIVFRPHVVPSCMIAGLWMAGWKPSLRWLIMIAGVLLPFVLLGAADWITWGAPFRSLLTYAYYQTSDIKGTDALMGPGYYVKAEAAIWGLALPLVLLTAIVGTRRMPILTAVTAIIFAFFSAVAFKEPRLITPALPLLFTLCGIGTADVVHWLAPRIRWLDERKIAGLAAIAWILLSLISGVRGAMRPFWIEGASTIRALDMASADPAACAIGVNPPDQWIKTGMVRIRADMRLYGATAQTAPQFNYVMSPNVAQQPAWLAAAGFSKLTCFSRACLFKRPGACLYSPNELVPMPDIATQQKMKKLGIR